MRKVKNGILKTINRALAILLIGMGFTGCSPDEEEEEPLYRPMYGAIYTSYTLKEKAIPTETRKTEPEIKVEEPEDRPEYKSAQDSQD